MGMKKHHLIVTFYFRPDLCAGSFRNTAFVESLRDKVGPEDTITVFTTSPNRYKSHQVAAPALEEDGPQVQIHRFPIPKHASGFRDQIFSFLAFYRAALRKARGLAYDAVYASSSRLFTAYLGSVLSRRRKVPLFLDMRDLFRENICEILSNPIARIVLNDSLRLVERRAFRRACHINLVSEGFRKDFEPWKRPLTFFTNGIDSTFEEIPLEGPGVSAEGRKVVIYAGNLGEGQGLHLIIPDLAKAFPDQFEFQIFGDGGKRGALEEAVKAKSLRNVLIYDPVNREDLTKIYLESDFLFVHLNRLKAFEKALPSKVFEYGAIGKPIIAGVAGYAREFIEKYLPDTLIFEPCNGSEAIRKLSEWDPPASPINRRKFIEKFDRGNIMDRLSDTYLQAVK